MLDFATILINWNHADETLQCIQMINSWNKVRTQVVVVDNQSHPEDRRLLDDSDCIVLTNESNLGFAGALNRGLSYSFEHFGDLAMVLNSDLSMSEDDVVHLLWTMKAHKNIGVLGPVLREEVNQQLLYSVGGRDIGFHLDTREWYSRKALAEATSSPLPIDYVPGTAFMIRRKAYLESGNLDTTYFFSGEMADYSRQVQTAGWQTAIDLHAHADHHRTERGKDQRNQLYIYYTLRNRFLYIQKHSGKSKNYWTLVGLRQWLGAILRGSFGKARALRLALKHGRKGTFGNQNHLFLKDDNG